MDTRLFRLVAGLAVPTMLGFSVPAARAQTAPALVPPLDTMVVIHAAQKAREKADSLAAHLPPGQTAPRQDARATAQYRDALAELGRGEFQAASVSLTAALARSRDNPVFRGDLAYAYLRLGLLDNAHNSYVQAYQAQQQNNWYLIGLAAVRVARADEDSAAATEARSRHDSAATARADSAMRAELVAAAGTVQLAVQNDSALADGEVAKAATVWYLRAGYRPQAAEWARIAVRADTMFADGWKLIMETDSVRGQEAARRYVALRPTDPRGRAYLAIHLINTGQADSALALAEAAAADTSYHAAAAEIFLVAAVQKLRNRDPDGTLSLLARGYVWAGPNQEAEYAYYTGRAQLVKVTSMLNDVEEQRDCALARRADTLVTNADRNLRLGLRADSARATQLIGEVIPQFRQNADNFVTRFCQAQPAQPAQPAPQAQPQRPPTRPTRPRPARP